MGQLISMSRTQTIESREVAKMVDKEHSKLLRDIRNYTDHLAEAKVGLGDFFIESEYKDGNNQNRPCYLITKQGCEMVANKLTGKKGTIFTARYVQRFNEMEQEQASYMIADPIKRAEVWIEEQREKMFLEQQNDVQAQRIAEYEPKISYLDTILSSTDTVTISQIAADYGMSAIAMNKLLNNLGIQYKVSGQWLLYKKHRKKGYTKSHTSNIPQSDGTNKVVMNTKWTQKGRLEIYRILEKEEILPEMDLELEEEE